MGIIFVIVAIVVVILTYITITDANDTELTLESEAASYQLSDFFDQYSSLVEAMATNVQIQEWMNTTKHYTEVAGSEYFADVTKSLKGIQAIQPDTIQTAWVADADSNGLIMSEGYIAEEGFEVASRPWFECTKVGYPVMTESYQDVATGKMILTVATSVYNAAGKAIGVSGMDISLDDVFEIVGQYKIGESGYVMLLSAEGMFIYHPNQELINTYITDMDISQKVVDAVLNKQELFTGYKAMGESKFGYVEGVGDTAQQLAEGNLHVEINVESEDEIGELADSIGKTVTRLKEYINYIDEIAEVLGKIANGKLIINLKYSYAGEFGKVKDALLIFQNL